MAATPAPLRTSFRGRIAAFVVCSGAAVTAFAGPAAAAGDGPAVKWSGRSDQLAGKVRLQAEVSTGAPVDGWVLRGVDPSGKPVFDPICEETFKKPRPSFDLDCRWDTRRYSDGRWSANQRYLLRLEARRDGDVIALGNDRDVSVDNPAAPPADVTVAYDPNGRRAVVSWSPNPEPDIERYLIEERVDKEPWRPAGESTTTSFERQLAEAGRHRFRVAAQRRRPDGEPGRPGEWTTGSADPRNAADAGAADGDADPAAGTGERASSPGEHRSTRRNPESAPSRSGGAEPPSGNTIDADRRTSGDEAPRSAANGSAPAARAAAAAPARHTPPANAAAPTFPASSGTAFQALALARPAPNRTPATAPRPVTVPSAAVAEPDDGFEQALPYRDPEPDTTAGVAAPLESELETPEPAVAVPAGRSAHRLRRLGGILLIVLGTMALTLVRPSRRRARADTTAASAVSAAAGPGDVAPLHDFEARLERLEARLLHERATSWVMETGQLPTG
ncbi:MAG: hypothetical protein AB1679_23950 [Actinomycetota bacterium]|jgi:hypothetical protein